MLLRIVGSGMGGIEYTEFIPTPTLALAAIGPVFLIITNGLKIVVGHEQFSQLYEDPAVAVVI